MREHFINVLVGGAILAAIVSLIVLFYVSKTAEIIISCLILGVGAIWAAWFVGWTIRVFLNPEVRDA